MKYLFFLCVQFVMIDTFVIFRQFHPFRVNDFVTHYSAKNERLKSRCMNSFCSQIDEIPSLDDDVKCGGIDWIKHVRCLDRSLLNLTGHGVCERMNVQTLHDSKDLDIYESIIKNERYVLISHGAQDDPIYNFGNLASVQAFARSWNDLTSIPSRLSVVSESYDEACRNELLHNVTKCGFFDGYLGGYRTRGDGKFIKINELCFWNCYDDDGDYIGQAALFDRELSPIVDNIEKPKINIA